MGTTAERAESDTSILEIEPSQRRRGRAWQAVSAPAAAAVVLAAVACTGGSDEPNSGSQTQPTDSTASPAMAVATGYLDAYGSFDRALAASYLADDSPRMAGWKRWNRWQEATQFRQQLGSCEESAASANRSRVVCPYEFHCLGSDRLDRGPFRDNSYTIVIRDGEIVDVQDDVPFMTNGFSSKMWEPFAGWVGQRYPKDGAIMYEDWPDADSPSLTDRSLELWTQHTQDYVDAGG
jgi:hypothetical protein